MYLTDYHLHSKYSFDGHEELQTICKKAIERGLKEIAITDHMDLYTGKPYEYILDFKNEYENLKQIKEDYKGRLAVRIGIELGQPQVNPMEAKRFLEEYELDFIIGSVHNMENDIDVGEYNFKEMDCRQVFHKYLAWLQEFADGYEYDVIGHVTYPLRYMANMGIYLDLSEFEEQIRAVFRSVIQREKGIELNTSGLYQKINDTMPSFEILKWYHDCGGKIITVGSDSHYEKYIGLPIRQGMELLKKAGFDKVATFENHRPMFHDI